MVIRKGVKFKLGFELKSSSANVSIAGENIAAGGSHIGLFVGYH